MINYKNKKMNPVPLKMYVNTKFVPFPTKNQQLNTIDTFSIDDNIPPIPQILIIGCQEYNTDKIINLVIEKLKKTYNISTNITTFFSNNKYISNVNFLSSRVTFDMSSVEDILASQMSSPDEIYSNTWQQFDPCINIFNKCFSECEFDLLHKKKFEKLFKYSKKYKIMNIFTLNYFFEEIGSQNFYNNFDIIFCTKDVYTKNINKLCLTFNIYCSNFYDVFNAAATNDSALVIKKNNLYNYSFKKIWYNKIVVDNTYVNEKDTNDTQIITENDTIVILFKINNITI